MCRQLTRREHLSSCEGWDEEERKGGVICVMLLACIICRLLSQAAYSSPGLARLLYYAWTDVQHHRNYHICRLLTQPSTFLHVTHVMNNHNALFSSFLSNRILILQTRYQSAQRLDTGYEPAQKLRKCV